MLSSPARFKLEIYIPESHVPALLEALAGAGAGVVGNYDHCASLSAVTGTWRPLPGARPYDGEVGRLQQAPEIKVETSCPAERIKDVLAAIRQAHPYEEPVVNILPLWFPE